MKLHIISYYIGKDLDVIDGNVLEYKDIDMSKIDSVHLYLIYDFGEVEVRVFLGWIEPESFKRLHLNSVRRVEIHEKERIMCVYIDFKELFRENNNQDLQNE